MKKPGIKPKKKPANENVEDLQRMQRRKENGSTKRH